MDYQRIIANTNRDNSFMRHNGILLTQMEKDQPESIWRGSRRDVFNHGGLCFWRCCSEQRNAICYGQQQL